jgi:hypothetical protein
MIYEAQEIAGSFFSIYDCFLSRWLENFKNQNKLDQFIILGELSLDGHIQAMKGVLPIASSFQSDVWVGANSFLLAKCSSISLSFKDSKTTFDKIYSCFEFFSDWYMLSNSLIFFQENG